ncbi:hypothetical protein GPA22_14895 [Aromatoleum toluvorans]|uniref:Uncharacterized protein n=1 Tax=Aromatoleum toluvorans TaxID=92002 RepID=A0ABX1Q057_9RHOO|nr:hypothetical protein [Aromatoleum toluvorans]NMG45013.1 hypothetical protein [Aromatoleum toluvorans]
MDDRANLRIFRVDACIYALTINNVVKLHMHSSSVVAVFPARARTAVLRAARRWRVVGKLLLALPVTAAHAEAPAVTPVSWICWYANGTAVSCRLGPPDAFMPAPAELQPGAADAGALLPAGKRPLPQIVRTILQEPEKLADRTISIPLFAESHDTDFVRELAEAVMCGTRKLCRVLFLRSSTDIALTLDAVEDPALN